jgi:hypothetical protein
MKQKVAKFSWDSQVNQDINEEIADGWRVVQIVSSHPATATVLA